MEQETFRPPQLEHADIPRMEWEAKEREERYDMRDRFRTEEEAWTDDDWARDIAEREQNYQHKDDNKI